MAEETANQEKSQSAGEERSQERSGERSQERPAERSQERPAERPQEQRSQERPQGRSQGRSDRPQGGRGRGRGGRRFYRRKKVDYFAVNKIDDINYKDVETLRQFIGERGKILPRRHTGLSSQHQRQLKIAIKRARNIALLPFAGEAKSVEPLRRKKESSEASS